MRVKGEAVAMANVAKLDIMHNLVVLEVHH